MDCRALSHSLTRADWLMDPPQHRHSACAMAGNSVATSQMYPETELSKHKRRGSAKLPPNKNRLIEHLNVTMPWSLRSLSTQAILLFYLLPLLCHGQGHLPLDQVAQSYIQPGLEPLLFQAHSKFVMENTMDINIYSITETLTNYWVLLVSSQPNPKYETSKEVVLNSITKILPAANLKPLFFAYRNFISFPRKIV